MEVSCWRALCSRMISLTACSTRTLHPDRSSTENRLAEAASLGLSIREDDEAEGGPPGVRKVDSLIRVVPVWSRDAGRAAGVGTSEDSSCWFLMIRGRMLWRKAVRPGLTVTGVSIMVGGIFPLVIESLSNLEVFDKWRMPEKAKRVALI
uniref:(northern house mosquito) hypothetical protein n=1 Tax=Culex pipiens TaxID=7175 RepID=A0A8D8CGS7_CULPI